MKGGRKGRREEKERRKFKAKKKTPQINTNGNKKQWNTKCYTLWVPAKLPAKVWYSENTACGQKY